MKRVFLLIFIFQAALAQTSIEARIAELELLVSELQQRISMLETQLQNPALNSVPTIATGDARNIQNWRQLRLGMSEQGVEGLLGSPERVVANQFFFVWYYEYPFGGKVEFDSPKRTVRSWNEP